MLHVLSSLMNIWCASICCRFDIVLLLLDQHEPTWNRIVSEHVLQNHQQVIAIKHANTPNPLSSAFCMQRTYCLLQARSKL